MLDHVWLGLTFITLLITGGKCLRNVRLEMIPEAVEHGHEATLKCSYDLEGVQLYSLKWYRGNYEFYRYSPSEQPVTKIFNFSWIEVDPNNSNQSQVTIKNVDFPLSGNFSCEVTADGPLFSTASSSKTLTVVSIPKGKPVIISERRRYEPGEFLKANCSTPSSKPPARLFFTLNDIQVGDGVTKENYRNQNKRDYNDVSGGYRQNDEEPRQFTELNLLLQPFHYINGQLNLRCTAKIPGIYEQSSELQLGSVKLRGPIPERVTSESSGNMNHQITELMIIGMIILHLHLR